VNLFSSIPRYRHQEQLPLMVPLMVPIMVPIMERADGPS
jgi:hypothetical protein